MRDFLTWLSGFLTALGVICLVFWLTNAHVWYLTNEHTGLIQFHVP